jgi:DNA (cytosine-5)-methyltransferase 1
MADADGGNAGAEREQHGQQPKDSRPSLEADVPGPVNGFWRAADWLGCRDNLWRPVEPGTFPMANGASSRVGRLRAYGNAINAEAAKEFIAAYLECQP